MCGTLSSSVFRACVALAVAAFCVGVSPSKSAGDPTDHSADTPPQAGYASKCPAKVASGAGIVGMTLMFSVSEPKQDVICAYSDGSGIPFQVDKGCDVEPTGVIADGMPSGGRGFTFGQHECRESSPGAGECHIVCPKR